MSSLYKYFIFLLLIKKTMEREGINNFFFEQQCFYFNTKRKYQTEADSIDHNNNIYDLCIHNYTDMQPSIQYQLTIYMWSTQYQTTIIKQMIVLVKWNANTWMQGPFHLYSYILHYIHMYTIQKLFKQLSFFFKSWRNECGRLKSLWYVEC